MRKGKFTWYSKLVLLAVIIAGCGITTAYATTSSSTNYQVTETEFNAGSNLESCSGQYCARATIGDMVAGSSGNDGSGSRATFGAITDDEPLLEVIVEAGQSHLGTLAAETTATKTAIIKIRNYMSEGYTLQLIGNAPKYRNHTLDTLTSPTASDPGTEQFGINAVANTSPTVGANPVQVPSDQTSFGRVEDNYKTPNLFMYKSGEVIARSHSESGRTDYTISMIVNVSNATPAGHYASDFSAVVVPIY